MKEKEYGNISRVNTTVALAYCCREERDEDEDGVWWHSGGSGSGRDNVMSEDTILGVLGFQSLPSLFESVQNLCVALASRATLHRTGIGRHCDGLGPYEKSGAILKGDRAKSEGSNQGREQGKGRGPGKGPDGLYRNSTVVK